MKKDKKSPLKAAPLRTPGQSIQDEINDFIDDKVLFPYLAAMIFCILAMYEWLLFGEVSPDNPLS